LDNISPPGGSFNIKLGFGFPTLFLFSLDFIQELIASYALTVPPSSLLLQPSWRAYGTSIRMITRAIRVSIPITSMPSYL
jgi:hypothetical protein